MACNSDIELAGIGRKHALKSHRIERHAAPEDPDFYKNAAEVIVLYLNPSADPAIFCVDGNTPTRALDRKKQPLPPVAGLPGAHGFEYYGRRTFALHAKGPAGRYS